MRAVVTWAVAIVIAAVLLIPPVGVAAAPSATLIADIHPSSGSGPESLTVVGKMVFFTATDGTHGRELWATDGTPVGTRLVRDIRPGSGGSAPRSLTRVGDRLYFSADDGSHGRELWISDGTREGTRLVRDLTPGAKGSGDLQIAALGEHAYFSRRYEDLWRTDGTAASTRLVRAFKGIDLDGSAVMRSRLYFSADGAMWKTDGTSIATKRISSRWLNSSGLTPFRGRIYFIGGMLHGPDWCGGLDGCIEPPRLWWTDGSLAGTKPVSDILATPEEFVVLSDTIYFNGWTKGIRPRLFGSDGTKTGTGAVVPRVRPLPGMQKRLGRLWMTRSSRSLPSRDELWVSDATASGTELVKGGTADWFTSAVTLRCIGLDGRLWFAAGPGEDDGTDWRLLDHELWMSDGTGTGTLQAVDINPLVSSFPRDLVKLGGVLLFSANDGEHGRELWSVTP